MDASPADMTYEIGQNTEADDWYFAQTKNGTWTVAFNLDDPYTGTAHLTASAAGATNSPTVVVSVNGTKTDTWKYSNDAGIYRSCVQSGKHVLNTCSFAASNLKKGRNTVAFTMSGIKSNGGVMWDCIKLEAGEKVLTGITQTVQSGEQQPVTVYTIGGTKVGTFSNLRDAARLKGIYIYRQGGKTGKVAF